MSDKCNHRWSDGEPPSIRNTHRCIEEPNHNGDHWCRCMPSKRPTASRGNL